MNIKKTALGLTLSLLLASGVAVADYASDYYSAIKTFTSGGDEAALIEMLTLAESGHADAQYYLALVYIRGSGVPQSYKEALKWYTKAAELGHVEAQVYLGIMYKDGEGVIENNKTAFSWFYKAAKQGSFIAQSYLAEMYREGEGVPENDKTAIKWYSLAAKQGYWVAQSYLAEMYEAGEGVLKDDVKAYMWHNIAASSGRGMARYSKDLLADKMTPADISKGQEMSSICLESNYTDC